MAQSPSDKTKPAAFRRAQSRLRTRLQARIVTLYSTRTTVLLDLSLTGARVKASAEMRVDDEIVLSWARYEAFGKIVWLRDGMCGIVFDRPISAQNLVVTRDCDLLPSDREIERIHAREWVEGMRRI